ncbi:MAG TPA: hypothetical protein VD772_04825 [Anseongella sp.]|nr:hypothetical protein [Anseongella sp.]
MKRSIFTLFVLVSFTGYCQEKGVTPGSEQITIYLDSVEVDLGKVYLSPKNLSAVNVEKQKNAVYLTSKGSLVFLTLDEILQEYLGVEDTGSFLYMVGNKIVLDKTGILIDRSFIKSVTRTDLSDAAYLNDPVKDMSIVTILISPEGDKEELRIRGLASAN